jgi:microsomal dipeptidase-like Zn-dependent dipeptidase
LIHSADFSALLALEFSLRKINEYPERYTIIRATPDIEEATAEGRPGPVFTDQGIDRLGGDLARVDHAHKSRRGR